ncbi:hypothetical protein M3P05_09735 [Sansalvadorimonas sp. 2012CJ34-2]|uniref:Uncharacterized protein n=1 Tax=Parendozoicomonas callyspongiae TaxID=2942213 RepID=A0ABT0PFW1_9GAMM|nr:hypothetical protein [Sansalvadorimonas sp. 2012CJ34-2]MCL6270205.1 hypothetical protein [Sansalvadorimonas sp. 2012CJ34-2]
MLKRITHTQSVDNFPLTSDNALNISSSLPQLARRGDASTACQNWHLCQKPITG